MKITELFLKYGIASLFGVTRYLHSEVERLQLRIWQLENRLDEVTQSKYQFSGDDEIERDSPLDDGWFDAVTELDNNGTGKKVPRDEIFGRVVQPKNIRRTVDDLMREAKERHNEQYTKRAMVEAVEQEQLIEEMIEPTIEDPRPVNVVLSDAKRKFLEEAGRTIMQTKSE